MLPPRIAARVLIVDDDAGLLDLLSMVLSDASFVVTTARDGAAGWRAFEAGAFDVVVLDLVMPELDGLELCRRIRRAGSTPTPRYGPDGWSGRGLRVTRRRPRRRTPP